MSDLSDQAVLERLAERVGVLDNKKLTHVVRLLEGYSRREHGDIVNHARRLRELDEMTRGAREETRSLAARWANVWDSVKIAFALTNAGLRMELIRSHERNRRLALTVLHLMSAVIQLDNRLDALEGAAGPAVPQAGKHS